MTGDMEPHTSPFPHEQTPPENPRMDATVKNAVKSAASAISQAKRGGPRTEEGKKTSSLNSVRYGFSASHLLLAGEDPDA